MLRVGVTLDSFTASAWIAKIVEDVQASDFARVELVILEEPSAKNDSSLMTTLRNLWEFSLFRLYERWDYKRNKADLDALATTDLSPLLSKVPTISVCRNRDASGDRVDDRVLAEVLGHNLDVILVFGSWDFPRGLTTAARYGVWSFAAGDGSHKRGGSPLFWELFDRRPVSRSTLQIFRDPLGNSRTIYQSFSSTEHSSLYRNRNPIYWKTAEYTLRHLHNLQSRGIEYIQSLSESAEQNPVSLDSNRTPNALRMILFMGRHLFRWLQARASSLQPDSRSKWCIAIRRRTAAHRFDDGFDYRIMPCPKDRFYADPFVVEYGGKTLLFFEDFPYAESRGVISYCELEPDGTPHLPVEVLRRPYHLSYPFVFDDGGEMYMIPETKENRTIELYRATRFPTTWVPEAVLLNNVYAVDATIHKMNGKLWMFAGVSNGKYSNCDELGIFFADELKGPWTPHPCNPVLSDVRRSRPAGALFYYEGRLIRPSQDCGKAYGYALEFSEVLTLTETAYEERSMGRLDPKLFPGQIGNHTYTRTERIEVIDVNVPLKLTRK